MTDRATFVEGLAVTLAASGMQRMAARVFAALLASSRHGLTAAEIADVLDVSAGAVSQATQYLTRTGLAERVRVPGERADRFEVRGTAWAEAITVETESIRTLTAWLDRGLVAVEGEPVATERLADTRDFFAFLVEELPLLAERWRTERAEGRR